MFFCRYFYFYDFLCKNNIYLYPKTQHQTVMIATNYLCVLFSKTLSWSLHKGSMAVCVLPFLSFYKSIKLSTSHKSLIITPPFISRQKASYVWEVVNLIQRAFPLRENNIHYHKKQIKKNVGVNVGIKKGNIMPKQSKNLPNHTKKLILNTKN